MATKKQEKPKEEIVDSPHDEPVPVAPVREVRDKEWRIANGIQEA